MGLTWSTELGIIGVVVTGLLSLTGFVIRSFNSRDDKRTTQFTSTLKELASQHRTERTEWRMDAAQREERANKLVEDLHETIREVVKPQP